MAAKMLLMLLAAFSLALTCACADDAVGSRERGCIFHKFPRDESIGSWEFQTKLPFSKLKVPFEELAVRAGDDLKEVAVKHPHLNITIHRHTRVSRTTIQDAWSLTTYDGKALYPEVRDDPTHFPWTDGYLRKRQSVFFDDPKSVYHPDNGSCPYSHHNTDLTVKMRNINLDGFDPENITGQFPSEVESPVHHVVATLTQGIECDVYCNAGNLQFKAKYWPVNMHQDATNLEALVSYLPGLSEALLLPECAPLPFRRTKYSREASWDMYVNNIPVRSTLTVEYKSQAKAFTGLVRGVAGEISLRMMRADIEEVLGNFSFVPVEELALVISEMHNKGWDYLKPHYSDELTWDDWLEDGEQAEWDDSWPLPGAARAAADKAAEL